MPLMAVQARIEYTNVFNVIGPLKLHYRVSSSPGTRLRLRFLKANPATPLPIARSQGTEKYVSLVQMYAHHVHWACILTHEGP